MQYRNNNTQISRREMEKALAYEIDMFRKTCRIFFSGDRRPLFWHNLLIESLALHTRVLIDFFYCDIKKYDDDIIAQDLLSPNIIWSELRPQLSEILKEAKEKADKQLAHLSKVRITLEKEGRKGWKIFDIFNEMNRIIEYFYQNTTHQPWTE